MPISQLGFYGRATRPSCGGAKRVSEKPPVQGRFSAVARAARGDRQAHAFKHGTSVDVFYNGVNHYQAVRPNPDPRQNRANALVLTPEWYNMLTETWANLRAKRAEGL